MPTRPLAARPPLGDESRVRLRDPDGTASRFIDGGWWPHSSDLAAELPSLIAEIEPTAYPKTWAITYNLADWAKPPHYIMVGHHRIRTGGFNNPTNKAMISLMDSAGWAHIDLVVIPPGTDSVTAGRALELSSAGNQLHADEVLPLAAEVPPTSAPATG
jgi:hypothetical protein